jgi:hypothetical protein
MRCEMVSGRVVQRRFGFNGVQARVSGHFEVDFYDAPASKQKINETFIPPRALPHMLQVRAGLPND